MESAIRNIRDLTTFGLPLTARVFIVKAEDDILEYFQEYESSPFILGGGSNIVLGPEMENRNFLKIEIPGIYITRETLDEVYIFAGAGEVWDDVVAWAVHKRFAGIEALSAIPGSTGATPVQNVGAYGAEIKDTLVSVRAYDKEENQFVEISNEDCEFSYRQSIFKGREKNRYIITSILLKLKKAPPVIPDYPLVKKYFKEHNIMSPNVEQIRQVITDIRWSKLPKPEILPNCGSFFENPIVGLSIANALKQKLPDMPEYDMGHGMVKIPAGFLIEKAGLKGIQIGPVGTYEKNALVLINHGGATYHDVVCAKDKIISTVQDLFGVTLKTEPEFIEQ